MVVQLELGQSFHPMNFLSHRFRLLDQQNSAFVTVTK
jgi:hypothetical protein